MVKSMDGTWLSERLSERTETAGESPEVSRLWGLLNDWASGFASQRSDVESASIHKSRRGLRHDESSSFLRAIDAGV